MLVKAPCNLNCPRENDPRSHITDDPAGTEVPDTVYYRRLLLDGSLEQVEVPVEAEKKKKTTAGEGA